jgi:RimJ/RimL family protein N-acetyltransferase
LLNRCVEWARDRRYNSLSIETQNVNVPACRFYAKSGCELAEIRRFAYFHRPDLADEAMLIWQLKL